MQLPIFHRLCLICTIVLHDIMFALLCLIGINFYFDNAVLNLDMFNITRVSRNEMFNMCSFIECRKNFKTPLFINISMTLCLCFQSVFFVNKNLRERIMDNHCSCNTLYYCIYIPKIISYFSYIMTMLIYQPLHSLNYLNVDIGYYIRDIWLYLIVCVGVVMIVLSLQLHLITNDELGLKLLVKLIMNKDVNTPEEALIGKGVIFHMCRNPFRGGVMLVMLFINSKWDIGKMVYTVLILVSIVIESMNEEIFYYKKYSFYKAYYTSIKSRFYGITQHKITSHEDKNK